MINKGKDMVPNMEKTWEQILADQATVKKIHKHLADVNDVISEEDIMNVKTNYTGN